MKALIERDKLDEAVRDAIALYAELQVGLSDVPSSTPSIPYVILYQSPSPGTREYDGSWEDPNDMPCYDYLAKCVGRDHRETSRTSSLVRAVFLTRGSVQNGYSYPFLVDGGVLNIVERASVSAGAIVPSDGPELFEVNDIYRLKVTAT